jgi:chitinase
LIFPSLGRSFTLTNPSENNMNAPTSGGGKAGEFTRESGFLAFYEICEMLKNGATYIWDDEQKVPYLVDGDQWVGFDDERSVRNKMKWLLENDYAGAMVWTVDMDDFTGTCAGRKYPLIEIMGEELLGKPKGISNFESIVIKASTNPIKVSVPNTETNVILEKLDRTSTIPSLSTNSLPVGSEDETNARIVCYYTNWSNKRPGIGKFEPENLDPTLCTHVIFAFAHLNSDFKLTPSEETDETNDSQKGLYDRVLALKAKNPNLSVLLAVGGWMMGPTPFRSLTENSYRQTLFTFNTIEYLRKKGFDGLDVCWEFPRGTEDKEKYLNLIKVYILLNSSLTISRKFLIFISN